MRSPLTPFLGVAAVTLLAGLATAQPADYQARTGGVLVSDQTLEVIALTRDLDGDGVVEGDGEVIVYFNDDNAAGLPEPTADIFTIFQSASGWVYAADGSTDAIYRLQDLNGDGDAQDVDEANIWFDNNNAADFVVTSPNGVWEADDGALYILNAGTLSTPPDAIYKTMDLNGDGDAQDAGEALLWMDVEDLLTGSSAFEIVFIDGVAYFNDLLGGETDAIFRLDDTDGDGIIKANEFNVFIDENNPFGCPVAFGFTTDGEYLYSIGSPSPGEPEVIARLKDIDGSGMIDAPDECTIIWDETGVPAGYELGSTFSLAVGPDDTLALTSNGGSDADNIFRLVDVNGDGDYLDANETTVWAYADIAGDFVDRARAVEFILGEETCPEDLNGDGLRDQSDLGILLASYDLDGGGDIDGDGDTDQADLGALLAVYGVACP